MKQMKRIAMSWKIEEAGGISVLCMESAEESSLLYIKNRSFPSCRLPL